MAKKIVLFADGTGNAFSAQQELNVRRLFDALDTSKKDQIAIYVEGVGTSSFRPWATSTGQPASGAVKYSQALSVSLLELEKRGERRA